jgi:hypothetical protein
MKIGVPKPSDYGLWLEWRNCGSMYQKDETKVKPEIKPIKQPSDGKQAKIQGIEKKRKAKGRGNNPRIKTTRDEIKDPDLIRVERRCSTFILSVNWSTVIHFGNYCACSKVVICVLETSQCCFGIREYVNFEPRRFQYAS